MSSGGRNGTDDTFKMAATLTAAPLPQADGYTGAHVTRADSLLSAPLPGTFRFQWLVHYTGGFLCYL